MTSPINIKEQNSLKNFRNLTADLNLDDITLLRFLRAREHNPAAAEDMLRKSMIWREENCIDSYVNWSMPRILKEDLTFKFTGLDFLGHPVFYVPVGRWMYRKWVEEGHYEDLVKFRYHLLESFMKEIKASPKSQMVAIVDMQELTYWKFSHVLTMQLLQNWFRDMEQNYPEIMKTFFVVNAPFVFKIGFNFVKPFMAAKTLDKVKVFGSNKCDWLPELKEVMPRSSIPSEYL